MTRRSSAARAHGDVRIAAQRPKILPAVFTSAGYDLGPIGGPDRLSYLLHRANGEVSCEECTLDDDVKVTGAILEEFRHHPPSSRLVFVPGVLVGEPLCPEAHTAVAAPGTRESSFSRSMPFSP